MRQIPAKPRIIGELNVIFRFFIILLPLTQIVQPFPPD